MSAVDAAFADVIGHARPKETFRRAMAADRLAHAYLLHGPSGVGKFVFARALAAATLAAHDVAKRDDVGALDDHPDFFALDDETLATLSIDAVRELIAVAGRKPVRARGRVFIVRDAERLSEEAQNAVLKTLEEPPDHCLMLLATAEPERLLPTIRSRSQSVRLAALEPEETTRVLERAGVDEADRVALLAALAAGSPGDALAIDAAGLLEDRASLLRFLGEPGPSVLGWVAERYDVFKRADSGPRRLTKMLVGTWAGILRDVACASTGAAPDVLWNRDLSADIGRAAAADVPERHAARVEAAMHALESLSVNTSPELVLSDLALKVCRPT